MKQIAKIVAFVALLALYWFYGGFVWTKDFLLWRLCDLVDIAFVFGAVAVCWGNAQIGVLHPVSFRPIFIALGTLAMAGAFAVMLAATEDRPGVRHWPFIGPEPTRPSGTLLMNGNHYV